MSGFFRAAKALARGGGKHTRVLLGGLVLAGAPFLLGLFGVDLVVPTLLAAVILGAVVAVATVKAYGEALDERDAAIRERDEARPRVSAKCVEDLASQLNKANVLFAEHVRSDEELDAYRVRAKEWVIATEALLDMCAGRPDADLFHDIAGRKNMRFANRYNASHNNILNNLNAWKSNLADLVKGYRQSL